MDLDHWAAHTLKENNDLVELLKPIEIKLHLIVYFSFNKESKYLETLL